MRPGKLRKPGSLTNRVQSLGLKEKRSGRIILIALPNYPGHRRNGDRVWLTPWLGNTTVCFSSLVPTQPLPGALTLFTEMGICMIPMVPCGQLLIHVFLWIWGAVTCRNSTHLKLKYKLHIDNFLFISQLRGVLLWNMPWRKKNT